MADYGTRKTDEAVKRAERRLRRVYKEAQRDIAEKLQAWQEAHKAREAKYRKMVADGKMTQADFDAWMRGQVFQDKQWQARKKEIDQVLLNADKAAAKIVNEGKVGVFADNANYIGYGLEHDLRIDSGFTLYDESTVARLIQDDPQILPMPAPGVVKDKAFPYYNKLMSSAITQGILQGETIPQIAQRIMEKTGESSYKSAVRNARTAYTGAQNAGRIEGLHQAQRLGIEVKKKWLATLDDRTRDTHRDLDGQIRNVDEPFQVDGDEIDFPGDPKAKPALVYNCRCTLIYEYPQYVGIGANVNGTNVLLKGQVQTGMQRLDNITREKIGYMTYREWEAMKQGNIPISTPAAAPKAPAPVKFEKYTETEHDEQYRRLLEEKDRENQAAYDADRNARRLSGDERAAAFAERDAHLARTDEIQNELMKYQFEATARSAKERGVEYLAIQKHTGSLTDDQIIARLAGGDMTSGSCASLSYCYIGQRAGYDVLDFRGGASQDLIASNNKAMLDSLFRSGYDSIQGVAKNYKTAGKRALKQAEVGKEYMFSCGRHAAIVRRTEKDVYEYLELQSGWRNGWIPFESSEMDRILKYRFGADIGGYGDVKATLVSVDQMRQDDRVLKILGYINTPANKQMKGSGGHER